MRPSLALLLLSGVASSSVFAGAGSVDLYVAALSNNSATWTTSTPIDGFRAYSIGYSICNASDTPSVWNASTSDHAITTSNMFVVRDGMIRQVGMSWVFHEFLPLQQSCGTCQPGPSGTLGPGCLTTTSSASAGQQGRLYRRSEVNASTGAFPFPGANTGDTSAIGQRLQVHTDDIETGSPYYFVEVQMISADEVTQDAKIYNNTFRRVTFVGDLQQPFPQDQTVDEPAIYAWRYFGNTPQQDPTVRIERVDIPGDGAVFVGSKATNIGGGVWRYTYAVQNVTSDLSIGSFTVTMGADPEPENLRFYDVDHHSGEPYDNTDWDLILGATIIRWQSPETFAENPNTNALRWGTMYTFSFESAVIPTDGGVSLGVFKPGGPATVGAPANVPSTISCATDINGDASTDFADLNLLLGAYGDTGPEQASDVNGDGESGFADLNLILGQYGQGC